MTRGKRGLTAPEQALAETCARLSGRLRACERLLARGIDQARRLEEEAEHAEAEIRRVRSEIELLGDADPPPSMPPPKLERLAASLRAKAARRRNREARMREALRLFLERVHAVYAGAEPLRREWRAIVETTVTGGVAREQTHAAKQMEQGLIGKTHGIESWAAGVRSGEGNPVWRAVLSHGGAGRNPTPEEAVYASYLARLKDWADRADAVERDIDLYLAAWK